MLTFVAAFIGGFVGACIGGFIAQYILNNIPGPFDNSQEEQPEKPVENKTRTLTENERYLHEQIKARK